MSTWKEVPTRIYGPDTVKGQRELLLYRYMYPPDDFASRLALMHGLTFSLWNATQESFASFKLFMNQKFNRKIPYEESALMAAAEEANNNGIVAVGFFDRKKNGKTVKMFVVFRDEWGRAGLR